MTPALAPRRGDVALVLFPFTDLSGAKLRPAVVLASVDEEFRLTGLDRRSTIRLTRIATLSSALVRRKLGQLGPATLQRWDDGLRATFGI